MTEIETFLRRHQIVGVDSNVLIALIESHPTYRIEAEKVFKGFGKYHNEVWFSVITIPEVLIHPLRKGRPEVATDYERRLFNSPFSFAEISLTTARTASALGGQYNLRVADALILASLLEHQITGFITAEKIFKRIKEIEILAIS